MSDASKYSPGKTCGPACAGHQALLVYILTTFLFSWSFWAPLAIEALFKFKTWHFPGQFFFASFGPLAGGIAASYYRGGSSAVTAWLSSIFCFRFDRELVYLTGAMLTAYLAVAAITTWVVTGEISSLRHLGQTQKLPGMPPVAVLCIWMLTFGLGEESGWRGWFYPTLLQRNSPIRAAGIVTAIWMLWHLPAFAFNENYQEMGWGIIGWAISLFFGAILLGWLFQKSGSIIPLIIWHGTFDLITASEYLPAEVPMIVSAVVVLQGIYLATKTVKK